MIKRYIKMNLRDEYNEDREYSDFYLKKEISNYEKQLREGKKQIENLSKVELIRKLHIVNELIRNYRTLNMITAEDKDYSDVIKEYEYYRIKLQETLDKFDLKEHNETKDSESWNEFKEEDNYIE